jgi:hypothetical protein
MAKPVTKTKKLLRDLTYFAEYGELWKASCKAEELGIEADIGSTLERDIRFVESKLDDLREFIHDIVDEYKDGLR